MNKQIERADSFSSRFEIRIQRDVAPPPAKADKCKQVLNGLMLTWGEVVNTGCGYLLGSQISRGATFNRTASGFAGLLITNGVLFQTAIQDMKTAQQRWICVAATATLVAAGLLTGAFVGL